MYLFEGQYVGRYTVILSDFDPHDLLAIYRLAYLPNNIFWGHLIWIGWSFKDFGLKRFISTHEQTSSRLVEQHQQNYIFF